MPVPLSPRISTVESVGAIFRTSPRIDRIVADGATMSGNNAWASRLPSASVTRLKELTRGATAVKSERRRP